MGREGGVSREGKLMLQIDQRMNKYWLVQNSTINFYLLLQMHTYLLLNLHLPVVGRQLMMMMMMQMNVLCSLLSLDLNPRAC